MTELPTITVHSDETLLVKINPEATDVSIEEIADGNVFYAFRPKVVKNDDLQPGESS